MKCSRGVLISLAAVLTAAGMVLFLTRSAPTIRLQDGSTITLLKTGYGSTSYRTVIGTPTQKLLSCLVPNSWKYETSKRGRWARSATARVEKESASSNALVVWLLVHSPVFPHHIPFHVSPVDEAGKPWGQVEGMVSSFPMSLSTNLQNNGHCVCYKIPAFPRRNPFVRLRVYALVGIVGVAWVNDVPQGGEWKAVGEIKLRNPAFREYPVWEAPDPPARQTRNGIEFSLTKLRNVELPSELLPRWGPSALRYVTAEFSVRSNGVATDSWGIETIEIEDATGNVWQRGTGGARSVRQTGLLVRGQLPTNETLKVRAKLENYTIAQNYLHTIPSGQIEFLTRVTHPSEKPVMSGH